MISNKPNHRKNKIITYIIYLFFSIYILSLNILHPQLPLNFSYYINTVAYSTLNVFNHIPRLYKVYINNISYVKQLEKEKIVLEQQIDKLQVLAIKNNLLIHENKELQLLFSIANNSNIYDLHNLITTKILFKNTNCNASYFMIKAGSKLGVTDDLAVISYNALIGRTTNTTTDYAKVILLTNSTSRIPVYTKRNHLNAVVVGNNTEFPTLTTYDKSQNLQDGDTIFTSGLDGIFPKNLPVGTIHQNGNTWIVKPFIKASQLLYVHIIRLNVKK